MPKSKFIMIGKGKVVHVVTTKAADLKDGAKGAQCPTVRKAWVSESIKPSAKGLSPEAALEIDECGRCHTHDVARAAIKAAETPEEKRAKAKEARDEVMERAKPKPSKADAKKRAAKIKGPKQAKVPKEKKERKASKTKAGKRSVGSSSEDKANELAAFAKEAGWSAKVELDGQHFRCTAVRDPETINVWFIDGKYDPARPAEVVVGSWSGKLRGAHSARRQMAGEGRDRPHPEPGKGRSGPRKAKVEDDEVPADESPEDAAKRLPFLHDDEAAAIIESILGKTIRWRNTLTKGIEEARVPANVRSRTKAKNDAVKITDHPTKINRRILSFLEVIGSDDEGREMFGPERNVALSNIVRVLG